MMASQSYTDAEAAPLIGGGGGGGGGGGRQRRTTAQQQQQQQQHNNNHYRHTTNSDYYDDSNMNKQRYSSIMYNCYYKCFSKFKSISSMAISSCCRYANPLYEYASNKRNDILSTNNNQYYYEDTYNDQPKHCSFGTNDHDGIWVNYDDQVGTIMSSLVWILIIYSMITIDFLASSKHLPNHLAILYETICGLALASHVKTMFTDPGSIPTSAVPLPELFQKGVTTHAMCSHCQTYKPPQSHHCRICNRCISRMDHHCPWMNNCIGAANLKHFILFLCYTWVGCAFALLIFASNYFFCNTDDCQFTPVLTQLVRLMTLLCTCAILFVSSMIMNVIFGLMTGIGTIDRLKKKANDTYWDSDELPIHLKDVFGIQGYWTWLLPIDPIFEDYDTVMGYSLPQRLLRESQMMVSPPPVGGGSGSNNNNNKMMNGKTTTTTNRRMGGGGGGGGNGGGGGGNITDIENTPTSIHGIHGGGY